MKVKTLPIIWYWILVGAMSLHLSAIGRATEDLQTGSGLEVLDPTVMPVLIEAVPAAAKSRGLTEERIEARVNAVLRKNGLKPESPIPAEHYFYVQVSVIGSSFAVNVSFNRRVLYQENGGAPRSVIAATWRHGTNGVSPSGATFILDAIADQTEEFANAFLKANRK